VGGFENVDMAAKTGELIEAVNALYNHPDEKVKKQANQWLEQWQQSLEAWSLSDAILHDPNSPFDAQYFCAQTLRTKVKIAPYTISSLASQSLPLLLCC
jgi:transportin-3